MSPRRLLAAAIASEKVRFLFVGGVNTVIGYGVFAVLELFIARQIGYLANLVIAYVIGTLVAFVLHRRFTFRVVGTGRVVVDFLRFASVYVVSLAINTVALPLLVELAHFAPLAAQALIVILTTLISYFGHKFFSFRRRRTHGSMDGTASE